jgi:acyl-[acyl-carrier-protein]-phospholipid O-acyltransferase/long-chain-fatty-acid--[acyl-carrier-protein] ligase
MSDTSAQGTTVQNGFLDLLRMRGIQPFLWTQFLGAFNDNVYKFMVSMRAMDVTLSQGGPDYLAIAGAVFVIPFLLFSGYSGHLADAISKRTVLVSVKAFEIFVMLIGLLAFVSSNVLLMMTVLFLMALHSTIFSPAKYGIVPEIVPNSDLSRANGLLEMSTFVAIVLGSSIGTYLFSIWKGEPWKMGTVCLAIACTGLATSFRIKRVPAAGATAKFRWNPFSEVVTGTKHLLRDKPLWLAVLAFSYFWFIGALFQLDLIQFGKETFAENSWKDRKIGLMNTALAIGIGAGSMLAGKLSGSKVELGLVPLGSFFMSVFCILFFAVKTSYIGVIIALAFLGLAAGLFAVPLNAYMQQRSEKTEKGRIIATNNFYNTIGMLLAAGVLFLLHDVIKVSPATLIFIFGFVTLLVTVYIVTIVPDFLVRFILWFVTHSIFRIRIVGGDNVPLRGPALLVSNHISHVDGFLIGYCIQRFVRFMIWKEYFKNKALRWFFKVTKGIPMGINGPREMVESIREARRQLAEGHIVCIFAEGAISRTGNMLPFKRGMEKIVQGLDVPIIPVNLDGMWGSIFSFERGKFFWKWPKRAPYPMTVSFGKPMPASSTAHDVRQAILELGAEAVERRKLKNDLLHLRFIRSARKYWKKLAIADSSGRELTNGQALTGCLLVADWVRKHERDNKMLGVLLPSSAGGALANIGITMTGVVPVNLNFTAGREAMTSAVAQCGIKTVLTSKTFLTKAKIEELDGSVYLEDILAGVSKFKKLLALLRARLIPARMLVRRCALHKMTPDSIATVIFSSGSTGVPKGVMLSHYNIISNIEAMIQVFWIGPGDCVIGVLPFFHSFGYTVTIWLPLLCGGGVAYHPNPMDAKAVGALVQKYKGTFLLSTPTFCSTYTRKCAKEEFATLRFVLVGAEKLREQVADAFREKFDLKLLEGYGCTEMSPVVAVNAPNFEAGKDTQLGGKQGTVGQPLPGVAVRIVDPATMEPLGSNQEGLLLVKGSNRMIGYLGQPEKTAEVVRDGWYVTGDIAVVDDEGFVKITDRLSRFSKIGGEMVPHLRVEEAIYAILGAGEHGAVVTGIPDEQRGERLAVLYTRPDIVPLELWQRLSETDLPKLWLPKRENIYQVDALPTLGTGKLDLRAIKVKAQSLASTVAQSALAE